jgi:hypothetical protein
MKMRGMRDRHRYVVDGVVTKFVRKKKAEANAYLGRRTRGTAVRSGLEEGTLDRPGRDSVILSLMARGEPRYCGS